MKALRALRVVAREIHHARLVVRGRHVEHWLNGDQVPDYECGSDAANLL